MSIIASPSLAVNDTLSGVADAAEARFCASAASPDEAAVVWRIAALRRPFEVRSIPLGHRCPGDRLELETADGVVHRFTSDVWSDIWLAVHRWGGESRHDGLRRVLVDWPVAVGVGQ